MISSPLMKGALATLLALLVNNVANAQEYEVIDFGANTIPMAINEQGVVAGIKLTAGANKFFRYERGVTTLSDNSVLGSASSVALNNLGRALGSLDQPNGLATLAFVGGKKTSAAGNLNLPLLTALAVRYLDENLVAAGTVVYGENQQLRGFITGPNLSAPLVSGSYPEYAVLLDWHPDGVGVGIHGHGEFGSGEYQYAAKFYTYTNYEGEVTLESSYAHTSGSWEITTCGVKSYNDIATTFLSAGSAHCSEPNEGDISKPVLRILKPVWEEDSIAAFWDPIAGDTRSEALGVNDNNIVVGFSAADDNPINERATIHRGVSIEEHEMGYDEILLDGEWDDLNSPANIGHNPKLKLLRALKINNHGEIIGYAAKSGSAAMHGFLLRKRR